MVLLPRAELSGALFSTPLFLLLFLLLLFFNYCSPQNAQQQQRSAAPYRHNFVVELRENWNGHDYIVRNVQPFFRVYHEQHRKVHRENPTAGKMGGAEQPLQSQLIEEHGSDQRLRMAAQFWREHNRQIHSHKNQSQQQQEDQQQQQTIQYPFQTRLKRAEKSSPDEQTPAAAAASFFSPSTTTKIVKGQEEEEEENTKNTEEDQQQQQQQFQQKLINSGDFGALAKALSPQQKQLLLAVIAEMMVESGKGANGQQKEEEESNGQKQEQLTTTTNSKNSSPSSLLSSSAAPLPFPMLGAEERAARLQQQEHLQEQQERATMILRILERNQSRSAARFGHHHLPVGEQKDTATWPWQLWPFMHCLTLECVCPLFRGNVEQSGAGTQCVLPNGKPLKRAIRKEFRTFTPQEMATFVETMRRFKQSGLYSRLGMIHRRSGVHSGPSFFPWHREFLKRLEIVYRALHPETSDTILGLPYWDSSLDGGLPSPEDSIMFSDYLLGEADESGFVTTGLFANWTTMDGRHSFQRMFGDQADGEFFNEGRIDFVLSQQNVDRVMAFSLPLHTCADYEMDDRFLEYSHDYVHYFISGDMQERFSSSNDPIFFMHHGFVDSIWELWRQKRQSRLQRERDYPRNDGECMPEWHFSDAFMPMLQPLRNMDALSNNYTDNMYHYVERPTCPDGRAEQCGNTKYLWCDTRSNPGYPVCVAKVKPGGNCKGLEWSVDVCYMGQCLANGRCSRPLEKKDGSKKSSSTFSATAAIGGEEEQQIEGGNSVQEEPKNLAKEKWHSESFMRRR